MKITDWSNVTWIEGGVYQAQIGYKGELRIPVSCTIDMGNYTFEGNGSHAVVTDVADVTLINGIYINANTGVYSSVREDPPNVDSYASFHNGFVLKGKPQFFNCNMGVQTFGADVKIFGAVIDGVDDDGIWMQGDNCEIAYCNIKNTDRTDIPMGDCIQFSNSINPYIHNNVLDHSNKPTKQCIMIGTGSSGGLIEDNYTIGGAMVINCRNDNMMLRRNTIIALDGTNRIVNIENVDSTLTEDNYIITNGISPYFIYGATNTINKDTVI